MGNLLSGLLGAVIGSIISSGVSVYLVRKQMRFESNRRFLEQLIQEFQAIHIAQRSRLEVSDRSINTINAFQVVRYKEFDELGEDLEGLKDAILRYRDALSKSLSSTTISTISVDEQQAQRAIETSIRNIMERIRKMT